MQRFFRRIAPEREVLLRNRWLKPLAPRLSDPMLWQFNRRNVARGVALGLFCGFLLPIGQVLLAAALSTATRSNLLIASVSTLVTNPLTFPPIYFAAYRLGSWLLAQRPLFSDLRENAASSTLGASVADLATAAALGLAVFAIASAIAGFLGTRMLWRVSIAIRWRRRKLRRPCTPRCK